tara:strand:+ start:20740 stop:21048 length:309 start_codon:yes stop_codon:yes gene_type:complete
VSKVCDERWRLLQQVHVNADYLEKDQVRWWSINELGDVISAKGQLGADRFRPYFLPVLQTALNLVRSRMEELNWVTTAPSSTEEEEEEEEFGAQEDVCNVCE